MKSYKILLIFACLAGSLKAHAQPSVSHQDTVSTKRIFLGTKTYQDSIQLSFKQLKDLYKGTNKAAKKLVVGTYMKPVAPIVMLSGIYLGYDAIKGVPASAEVNGVVYDYKIRSIKKLLLGLVITATGGSLIEYSNELVQQAAQIYNEKVRHDKRKVSVIQKVEFGVTPTNQVGFNFMIK